VSLFNFNFAEVITFFAVVVRYSVLFSILPLFGDRMVPGPVKILTSFVVALTLFPALVASGEVVPKQANLWAATVGGITGTIALEVVFGLALGYVARMAFDGISFGANLIGNFMGFASASYFDPHQESQTEVVAQVQNSLAMLIFLAIDGHHSMLQAALHSYRIVGIGSATLGSVFSHQIISISAEVFRYGLQLAGPVAISLFSVNLAFGMMSKAVPQMNIFVLSFAVTAFVGFVVLLLSLPEFQEITVDLFDKSRGWMQDTMAAMSGRTGSL